MKKQLVLTVMVAFISISGFAQLEAKNLYSEFIKNGERFEAEYFGKELTIQGVIFAVMPNSVYVPESSSNDHWVTFTGTGYEIFITCKIPYDQKDKLLPLRKGETYTVTGTYSEKSGKGMILTGCTFSKPVSTNKPATAKQKVPADIPFGKYNVYQGGGAGFAFQYALTLKNYTAYLVYGKSGACVYNAKTKIIRFTSGPLKGFIGKYRPINPDNEMDPPTIVISFDGKVPEFSKGYGGTYQYAYWKE